MPDLIVYPGWRSVPSGLFTKSQLADLDLPRVPGAPARAWVETSNNWRGKKDSFPLYALRESVPSPASAASLEAARQRATGGRVCDGCGARPDRPPAEYGPGYLCQACALMERLAARHRQAITERAAAVAWAREMLAAPAVVLRVDELLRPAAPSGRRDPRPVALRVDAVHASGKKLLDVTVRVAGPRTKSVPADAVDPATVADRMRTVLTAPAVVSWSDDGVYALGQLYGGWPNGTARRVMQWEAAHWRGDIDPDTLQLRSAIDPATAARVALLLRRMAATEIPEAAAP